MRVLPHWKVKFTIQQLEKPFKFNGISSCNGRKSCCVHETIIFHLNFDWITLGCIQPSAKLNIKQLLPENESNLSCSFACFFLSNRYDCWRHCLLYRPYNIFSKLIFFWKHIKLLYKLFFFVCVLCLVAGVYNFSLISQNVTSFSLKWRIERNGNNNKKPTLLNMLTAHSSVKWSNIVINVVLDLGPLYLQWFAAFEQQIDLFIN